jgi:4-cresol dehydrogenase (hydroxylating)
MACYRELLDRLTASGYHSYRLGIQSSAEMIDKDSYSSLLAMIKRALDPNGILAPGRYGIDV